MPIVNAVNADHPAITERRLHERQIRVFKPALIQADGHRVVGMMRDMSRAGVGIDVGDESFHVGQSIEYSWGTKGPFSGKVIWSEGGRIGVAHDELDVHSNAAPDQYRSVRIPIKAAANIYLDGKCIAAEILNFAQKGFCAFVTSELRQGALATIEIGKRSFHNATAKWIDGERVGFSLAKAMSLSEMNALQRELQA